MGKDLRKTDAGIQDLGVGRTCSIMRSESDCAVQYLEHYRGKRVLVTGHTGFKGSWLSIWLEMLGAEVYGYALPAAERSLYEDANVAAILKEECLDDIRSDSSLEQFINRVSPDVVFHLAAEAIVGNAHKNPVSAWETNVIGTLKLMHALRQSEIECRLVIITSDKCYENNEWVWGYREQDVLGGKDMYSASKAAIEILVSAFFRSYLEKDGNKLLLATARAGNVIGGGDWSDFRLVPDCIRSWERGETVTLRNPGSTRPWQHVLEPLRGYMRLGYELSRDGTIHGEAFNFGPDAANSKSVKELVKELCKNWPKAKWTLGSGQNDFSESSLLALNCDKAGAKLKWRPALNFVQTAEMTAEWYFACHDGANTRELCINQILAYQSLG